MSIVPDKSVQEMPEYQMLAEAFGRFNEASAKLQSKYELLAKESEVLRQQLHEKDLEVKRAEKLATLGETAAALAHEIRNPLGAMKLFMSLLRQDLVEKPDSIAIADQIDQCMSTLDHVVSNILQFSKQRKLDSAPLNLHLLVEQQVEQFERTCNPLISIECDLRATPMISGNEHGLKQVIFNILRNSSQALGSEGSIRIRTFDGPDHTFILEIEDDGPGISEGMKQRVFEPFVSTKNEGTGLGLAVVKQILDQHGAKISVENKPGACFRIVFSRK